MQKLPTAVWTEKPSDSRTHVGFVRFLASHSFQLCSQAALDCIVAHAQGQSTWEVTSGRPEAVGGGERREAEVCQQEGESLVGVEDQEAKQEAEARAATKAERKNGGVLRMSASRHPALFFFCRWDISLVFPIIVLKLAETVLTSFPFQTWWPNWLDFFRSFQKNSVYDRKKDQPPRGL